MHTDITIALGGNAIIRRNDGGSAEQQFEHVRATARELVRLVEEGDRILVTHGNGPQVGTSWFRTRRPRTWSLRCPWTSAAPKARG